MRFIKSSITADLLRLTSPSSRFLFFSNRLTQLKMAPREVFEDDETLTKFLDGLIESGTKDRATKRNPVYEMAGNKVDVSFTPRHIHEGIYAVNDLLREGGQCAPLPALTEDNANMPEVLAAAVTAIVRLSRCCKANFNLRAEAEQATQAAQSHVEDLSRRLHVTKEKAEKKDSALVALRSSVSEAETKHHNRVRKLSAEITTLNGRLANAAHRENQFVKEANQRDRQFAMLQKRVHSLMGSANRISFEPVVTSSLGRLPRAKYAAYADGSEEGTSYEEEAESGALGMVLEENFAMRGAVRAVHAELDDFFVKYPAAFPFLKGSADTDDDEADEVDDEKENSIPMAGPSEERMLLPFEMIRDEFEVNLERKLDVVRAALKGMR